MANGEDNTTESEIKVDAGAKEESQEESDTEASKKLEKDKDYEAELQKEKDRADKAEKVLAERSFNERKKRREEGGDEEEEEDKPLTRKELDAVLTKHSDVVRKETLATVIKERVSKLASSDAEANLIMEVHKNRIWPDGLSLDEQVEEAYAIANRKKIIAENSELKRALRGKDTKSNDAAEGHRDSAPIDEPKFSEPDLRAIKSAGYVWDGKQKLFTKPLKGGKILLTYDPKTKRTVRVNK